MQKNVDIHAEKPAEKKDRFCIMVYLCERCGAVSRRGRAIEVRNIKPIDGVIEEAHTKRLVELCADCADEYEAALAALEITLTKRFFGEVITL